MMLDIVLTVKIVMLVCEEFKTESTIRFLLCADRGPVLYKPLMVNISRGRAGD